MKFISLAIFVLLLIGSPFQALGLQNGPSVNELGSLNLSRLSQNEFQNVELYSKSLGLDWSFELDGCDSRARMLLVGLNKELGLQAGIVKLNESISITSRQIPWQPSIEWGHHTAAFVQVNEQLYVLDFALFDVPVLMSDWLTALRSPYAEAQPRLEFVNSNISEYDIAEFEEIKNQTPKLQHLSLPSSKTLINFVLLELLQHTFAKKHISEQYGFFSEEFILENHYPGAQQALDDLDKGTRCVLQNSEFNCTSYIKVEAQTCYFNFKTKNETLIQIDQDLICF